MATQPRPADLAALQARLTIQEAEIARLKRRRLPRRLLPILLATMLATLIPLATFAANPFFSDLGEAAPVHRENIQAIGNAGITTGFENPADPTARLYNPKGLVTREEMASFLARTAGLGGNPAIANAATVGGYAPNGLLRASRATGTNTDPFSVGTSLFIVTASNPTYQDLPGAAVTIQAPGPGFVLVSGSVGVGKGSGPTPTIAFARLRDASPGAPAAAISPKLAAGSNSTNQEYATLSTTFLFPVSGTGTHTYTIQVAKQGGDVVAFNGALTALFVPFGYDGGSAIAP